jgi:ABC-type polysaccharide/polyol phosphate transport system ATPase subunit
MTVPNIVARGAAVHYPIVLTGAQQSLFAGLANSLTAGRFAKAAGNVQYVAGVHNVNLEIKSGERVGLIGRNGAGKSTMLKLLAGVLPPSRGTLSFTGTSTNILFLGAGMDPDLTGYENIARMSQLLEIPKSEWANVKADVEDFTELGKFLALPVRTYSSGMSLRLGFAMATSYPRDILVVDEVIGAGDMFFMNKAVERIQSYTEQAKILVLATHGYGALESFCNRAIFMEAGKIIADGDTKEVWQTYVDRGAV